MDTAQLALSATDSVLFVAAIVSVAFIRRLPATTYSRLCMATMLTGAVLALSRIITPHLQTPHIVSLIIRAVIVFVTTTNILCFALAALACFRLVAPFVSVQQKTVVVWEHIVFVLATLLLLALSTPIVLPFLLKKSSLAYRTIYTTAFWFFQATVTLVGIYNIAHLVFLLHFVSTSLKRITPSFKLRFALLIAVASCAHLAAIVVSLIAALAPIPTVLTRRLDASADTALLFVELCALQAMMLLRNELIAINNKKAQARAAGVAAVAAVRRKDNQHKDDQHKDAQLGHQTRANAKVAPMATEKDGLLAKQKTNTTDDNKNHTNHGQQTRPALTPRASSLHGRDKLPQAEPVVIVPASSNLDVSNAPSLASQGNYRRDMDLAYASNAFVTITHTYSHQSLQPASVQCHEAPHSAMFIGDASVCEATPPNIIKDRPGVYNGNSLLGMDLDLGMEINLMDLEAGNFDLYSPVELDNTPVNANTPVQAESPTNSITNAQTGQTTTIPCIHEHERNA